VAPLGAGEPTKRDASVPPESWPWSIPISVRTSGENAAVSVDFEDWHQLTRRGVGDPEWRRARPAIFTHMPRQLERIFGEPRCGRREVPAPGCSGFLVRAWRT